MEKAKDKGTTIHPFDEAARLGIRPLFLEGDLGEDFATFHFGRNLLGCKLFEMYSGRCLPKSAPQKLALRGDIMLLSKMRRLCVLIFLTAVTCGPAFADSMFTLTFDPLTYTTTPNGTVHVTATVLNTGTTTLANFEVASVSFLGSPFYNVGIGDLSIPFGIGSMLLPGASRSFDFVDVTFDNAPANTYDPFVAASLELFDVTGALVEESATTFPTITVTAATPEPETLVLLGTGALGLIGTVRRRYRGQA